MLARKVQRIFPPPSRPVTIADAYGAVRPRPASGRPWIALCMVASIDGSTVADGGSAGLSGATDRAVMLTLRSLADMIIVGAGTVRAEGYGPPATSGQRIGVVTRSGQVDTSTALFRSGAGFVITTETAPAIAAETVRAGTDDVDLAAAVHRLPGNPAFVQAEGGATLNGSLATADLLDEINITASPLVIAGDGPRAVTGVGAVARRYRVAHVIEDDSFLFSRYVRVSSVGLPVT